MTKLFRFHASYTFSSIFVFIYIGTYLPTTSNVYLFLNIGTYLQQAMSISIYTLVPISPQQAMYISIFILVPTYNKPRLSLSIHRYLPTFRLLILPSARAVYLFLSFTILFSFHNWVPSHSITIAIRACCVWVAFNIPYVRLLTFYLYTSCKYYLLWILSSYVSIY